MAKTDHIFETFDLGMAAFMLCRGLELSGWYTPDGPGTKGKIVFAFLDPEHKAQELQVAFTNSEAAKFDEAVRKLKKLCFDRTPPQTRARN